MKKIFASILALSGGVIVAWPDAPVSAPESPTVCVVQPSYEPPVPRLPAPVATGVDRLLSPDADPPVVFFTSLDAARAMAIQTGKPLLVVVSSKLCEPCRRLESWQARPVFRDFLGRFVLYREDVRGNKFGATFSPTQIVYAVRDGKLVEVSRRSGVPADPNVYWQHLNRDWRAAQ